MKNMKKIVALLVAVLMLMSSFAALAEDPVPGASTPATITLDPSISVTGLDVGDVVKFYQVLQWDQSSGWGFTTDFAGLKTSGLNGGVVVGYSEATTPDGKIADVTGIKEDVLKYIAGVPGNLGVSYDQTTGKVTQTPQTAILGRINSALAAKIADIARTKTPAHTISATDTSVTWNKDNGPAANTAPAAGLYIALVTPAVAGTVYNPIFVSADYKAEDLENYAKTQLAVLDPSTSYSDKAMAKKTVIDLKKTIEHDPDTKADPAREDRAKADDTEGYTATSVDVGETLQFKVVTTIPEYNDTYTSAAFKITDTLTGLKLVIDNDHKFIVKANGTQISSDIGAASDSQYTTAPANDATSYEINFTSAYILGLDAATPIEITYFAKITDTATHVINPTDNTVKVEFSNNPSNLDDKGTLIDRTNQYSFSIDAIINGHDEWTSSELIKVGVDKDGNNVYAKVNLENGETDIPALPGATFVLLTANPGTTNDLIGKNKATLDNWSEEQKNAANIYHNSKGYAIINSAEKGKMTFNGLDVGTYYLMETCAPEGFIRDTNVYTITISASYVEKTYTEKIGEITVSCKAEVLDEYTVKVEGNGKSQTSKYKPVYDADDSDSVTNQKTGKMSFTNITNHSANDDNYNAAADHTTLLVNTQGIELPSTGGMGTTILYIGGSILVILAAVLLITKRRMSAND